MHGKQRLLNQQGLVLKEDIAKYLFSISFYIFYIFYIVNLIIKNNMVFIESKIQD